MKTTLSVTILILGLVLPQPKEALVVPFSLREKAFSNSRYFGSRTPKPDLPPPAAASIKPMERKEMLEIPKNNAELKYQEDLKKILLILNRPKFIYKLLWSYQKTLKKVKDAST